MENFVPKKGDKVWVWHFGSLDEVEVLDIFNMSGMPGGQDIYISYAGCATRKFFKTRNDAVESILYDLCYLIVSKEKQLARAGLGEILAAAFVIVKARENKKAKEA